MLWKKVCPFFDSVDLRGMVVIRCLGEEYSRHFLPPPARLWNTWYSRESFIHVVSADIANRPASCRSAELADPVLIEKFTHLQSLSFLNRYAACYQPVEAEHSRFVSIRQTTATTSIPLFSLGTFCEALWKSDLQRLSTLAELTLVLITDVPDPISGVFRHFPLLRSLTVLVGDDYDGDIFAVLHAHPNALPRLTAFRLSHPYMDTETEVEAVATFLQKRTLLERLELGHYWSSCAFGDLEPVLDILPELPRLRVLGFELGDSGDMDPALTPDHLLRLGRFIPPGLTVLSLWVAATTQPELTEDDWIHFVRIFLVLSFQ